MGNCRPAHLKPLAWSLNDEGKSISKKARREIKRTWPRRTTTPARPAEALAAVLAPVEDAVDEAANRQTERNAERRDTFHRLNDLVVRHMRV